MKDGIVSADRNLSGVGIYSVNVCSIGNEGLFTAIFVLDYCLVVLSIMMSYQGRNSKYFFFYNY